MRRGPRTPDGIAAVTRNLPPPEHSGPRTIRGKASSRLNSLRHGMSSEGFLPCKHEYCYFRCDCPLVNNARGRAALYRMRYGDPCPLELAYYLDTIEMLAQADIGDAAWRHEWAMTEVRIMRRQRMTAVEHAHLDGACIKRTLRWGSVLWRTKQELLVSLTSLAD